MTPQELYNNLVKDLAILEKNIGSTTTSKWDESEKALDRVQDYGKSLFALAESKLTVGSNFAIGSKVYPGLGKLVEEAGEVLQVIGKLMGTYGAEQHWDGTNLRTRLEEELADLMAANLFVTEVNKLSVSDRLIKKLDLFRKWHKES